MNDQGQAGELLELAGLLEGSSFRVWPKYAATIHLFWPCRHWATGSLLV